MAVLAEALKDNPYSPFRTASLTERPDTAASKLLEGRVGLILDGSPMMLCVPFFFIEYFHSPDDYYQNYLVASFARVLRFLCFYLSVSVPALYVALVLYHQEIMPTQLLISIATARSGVPFPLILETLLLLIAFDVLRDASYRMSPALGQSLSIVGALILGEASVSARLVSAPLVIVTALTGIAGLINPELKSVSVFFRYGLLLAATLGGIYAVIFGICGITLWLCVTDTFGLPFSDYLFPDKRGAMRDTLVRIPWAKMRPHTLTGGRDYEED
jgi:spore germination protein KA